MTLAELRAEVWEHLSTTAGAQTFWTDADIDQAINEGYAEMSDASEWNELVITLPLLAGRPYYDLRTICDRPVLSVKAIWNPGTHRWLLPAKADDLDRINLRWEIVNGQPLTYFLRGLFWLGLYPKIASEVGSVQAKISVQPDPLVEDGDSPGFPEPFHHGLVDYAVSDLWMQDAEATKGLTHWKDYVEREQALVNSVADRVGATAGGMMLP